MSRVGHTSSKHCLSVCPQHHGVHCSSKGVETDGHTQGYKNLPVPRRLVGESQIPPGVSPEYSGSSAILPRTRLASELGEIRTGTQASLRICRLPLTSSTSDLAGSDQHQTVCRASRTKY